MKNTKAPPSAMPAATIQDLIHQLNTFWKEQGCLLHHGYDLEMGAGTFNPTTFLRCLGPEPYYAAYVEPSRRPTDGRYGENPNRVQHFHQYQVILKPSPSDIQTVYLRSLEAIGIDLSQHDIRFVHDDWESPTLGASGLGWEVWLDGQEVTQITYFQTFGSLSVKPVTGEITYGIERLAMYLQNVDSIFDLKWNEVLTYGDIYHANEVQWSHYNFEQADIQMWLRHFEDDEREAKRLISLNLPLPAYDFVAKASHAFNILDARGAISVSERTHYIARIRDLARTIALAYITDREEKGFPLINKFPKTVDTAVQLPGLPVTTVEQKGTFLLEIGSEELPASFVPVGLASLEKKCRALLKQEGLSFEDIHCYATPRRLALTIHGLAGAVKASQTEKKGPPLQSLYDANGSLTTVGEGFFRSLNRPAPSLAAIQDDASVEIRSIKGIDYLFVKEELPERSAASILAAHLPSIILSIDFPKKMRWADSTLTYARPLLWILALYDDVIIPFATGPFVSGRTSFGHRQLQPDAFEISHAEKYVQTLLQHQVMVDHKEREKAIREQLKTIEKETHTQAILVEEVMKEVLHLVEWPFVIVEPFEKHFLEAPKELLASEMVQHQRYFPLEGQNGKLTNAFVIVCNNTPSAKIRKGNANVLTARLSDGLFLYKKDLHTSFETWNEKLKLMSAQKELGTLFDKVSRLQQHVQLFLNKLKIDSPQALRAASLSKADLVSQVVYEFPDLQGIMGKYYALQAKEEPKVAQAIEEQWMPIGESGALPSSLEGALLSIADKIDNLIGCFGTDRKPTSSNDPYALRRQVLGLLRIVIAHKLRLPLKEILIGCVGHFPKLSAKEQIAQEIIDFIANRVRTVFQQFELKHDEIEASLSFGFNDVYDLYLRIQALHAFRLNDPRFSGLYEVYKRARGQLKEDSSSTVLDTALLVEEGEKGLYHHLQQIKPAYAQAIEKQEYDKAYQLMASMQEPLAKLFNEVKILSDDVALRHNRIALLKEVFALFEGLLDFDKLQEK